MHTKGSEDLRFRERWPGGAHNSVFFTFSSAVRLPHQTEYSANRVNFTDASCKCTGTYVPCSLLMEKQTGSEKFSPITHGWRQVQKTRFKIRHSKFYCEHRRLSTVCGHRCFIFKNTVAHDPQKTKEFEQIFGSCFNFEASFFFCTLPCCLNKLPEQKFQDAA